MFQTCLAADSGPCPGVLLFFRHGWQRLRKNVYLCAPLCSARACGSKEVRFFSDLRHE
jgi:hypothetical protein